MPEFFEIHIDESNPSGKLGSFILMGGLILSSGQQIRLHERVSAIREEWNVPIDHVLKFNMKKLDSLTTEDMKAIKSQVIDAVVDVGGVAIAYAVLTDIVSNLPVDVRISRGLDQIVDAYSRKFLRENDAYGSVCIDRRDGDAPFKDIERIFRKGQAEGSWPERQFDRVIHSSVTTAKSSYLNSCLDVVLGSIQYCVNLKPNDRSWDSARMMYPRINRLLYRRVDQLGRVSIRGNGFLISPKEVRVPAYRMRYDEMIQNLNALLR
jgi:hypothetical protein